MATSSNPLFQLLLTAAVFYVAYTIPWQHRQKQTNLLFYVHDHLTGDDATTAMIGGKSGHESNIFHFGSMVAVDCPVTEGPGTDSRVIGRAQGIYVNSQLDGKALYLVFSVVFTTGEYEGSSLEIQGPDVFAMKEREFGVVSGTGRFRFVKGFGILETEFMDLVNLKATLKLNVTVKHY